jgi:prophage regulatory protein
MPIADSKGKKTPIVTMKPLCIDLDGVVQAVALSRTGVLKLIREGKFPQARQLSPRRVGWLVRELEEWMEARPVWDILPPPSGPLTEDQN